MTRYMVNRIEIGNIKMVRINLKANLINTRIITITSSNAFMAS